MFETHDEAQIPLPPVFGDPGLRMWSYVKCRLHAPWFHVVCSVRYEEDWEDPYSLRETMFLTQVEQVLQLQEMPQPQIVEINLVSPGHMNGSDHWKLEPLAEIWEGIEPESENQRTFIYVLDNGQRYVDSALDTREDGLLNKRRLLKWGTTP